LQPLLSLVVIFFFQAEDGIRDKLVTGVQTCALPISIQNLPLPDAVAIADRVQHQPFARVETDPETPLLPLDLVTLNLKARPVGRSEERRVGKEGRCQWAPYHYREKNEG